MPRDEQTQPKRGKLINKDNFKILFQNVFLNAFGRLKGVHDFAEITQLFVKQHCDSKQTKVCLFKVGCRRILNFLVYFKILLNHYQKHVNFRKKVLKSALPYGNSQLFINFHAHWILKGNSTKLTDLQYRRVIRKYFSPNLP